MENLEEIGNRTGRTVKEVKTILNMAKRAMIPVTREIEVIDEHNIQRKYLITRKGIGKIKSKFGEFWQYDFEINDRWKTYSVLVCAEMNYKTLLPYFRQNSLLIRTDCGCETGQLFGDLTCECKDQLEIAMDFISKNGEGMIIHLGTQDGRGMGLPFKLATLWLQHELKVDTVESATLLSSDGKIDIRTYEGVIAILKYLKIQFSCEINLATNNPKKSEIFKKNGYLLRNFVPVVAVPTEHTRNHLLAKQNYLGHMNLMQIKSEEDTFKKNAVL